MARGIDVKEMLGIWQEVNGQGEDGLLKMMQSVVQKVLEEELRAYLQAESHERTDMRAGYRKWVQAQDADDQTRTDGARGAQGP